MITALIRATRPDHPHEGTVHAANLANAHLTRAEADGWEIEPINHLPTDLNLPSDAAKLLAAVAATNLPWSLTRRPPRTGDGTETVIEIRGLEPDRSTRWLDWQWDTGGELGPDWISLKRAHELLADRHLAKEGL